MEPLAKAVFFDRDGTLMHDAGYCSDPADVRVYNGIPEALAALKVAGYLIILISNQSGIARGLTTLSQHDAVHAEFLRQIGEGLIDASYYCPDAPDSQSLRRKPEPGMVLEAAAKFGIDLQQSWFVGDKRIDVETGQRAGARTVQVLTGNGRQQPSNPDFIAEDAVSAVTLILRRPL